MSELQSSLKTWFDDKISSPLYSTYLGFALIWNWHFFQVILLEDASLFKEPRIEYLKSVLFSPFNEAIWNWLLNTAWHILPPVLFTYLAIVYLPRLHKWAYEIYISHYFERKAMFYEYETRYEKKMLELTTQQVSAKKERVNQEQIIDKLRTQEEKWQEELEQVKRPHLLKGFQALVDAMYKQGGFIYAHAVEKYISNASEIIAFADINSLVEIEKNESGVASIQLTDKGKHFSRILSNKGIILTSKP